MRFLFLPWLVLGPAFRLTMQAFESILGTRYMHLVLMLLGLIVFWHIYTPIHELIHVGACLLGGGSVTELALQPQYGAALLHQIFPFVVPQSDYAGQLTGFTTPNYWVYAFVDLAPYLLSLFGLTLIEWARRSKSPMLFGAAIVLAFIPFMSIPGDYYEAVSLVTTQIAESWSGLPSGTLISDDVFRSIGVLQEAGHLSGQIIFLVGVGVLVATYLAMMTLAMQYLLARRWLRLTDVQAASDAPSSRPGTSAE